VIGNGDVTTPEAAVHMKSETGCAGVSVRTQVLMQTGVPPPEPGIEDRVRVMSRHPVPLLLAGGSVPPIYTKGGTLAYFYVIGDRLRRGAVFGGGFRDRLEKGESWVGFGTGSEVSAGGGLE